MPNTIVDTGHEAMLSALEEYPHLTTVNDATAVGAIRACRQAGRVVPDEVAIVALDNEPWAQMHIVLGDLKGIRQRTNGEVRNSGRAGNLKLHTWPFDTFARMLAYKANLAGITIAQLSERDTSRTCSVCDCLNPNARVHRGLYVCSECGATINADVNGAVNILHKYLQGLEESTGVPVRVGGLPTIWWPLSWSSAIARMPHKIDQKRRDDIERYQIVVRQQFLE